MAESVKPFFFYSGSLPKILQELKLTIAYSTYQAGKLIFVSSLNGKNIIKYAKNFKRPMGIAYSSEKQKLGLASKTSIEIYASNKNLSLNYPEAPKRYDKLFVPQSKYYTGYLDTHEIEFGGKELWIVNTMFSCISTMNEDRHFNVYWKPEFISDLEPEDRCHLNGLALENGNPAYVTAFDTSNTRYGWKNSNIDSGVLIDVRSNEILVDNLPMPHSPVLHNGKIYYLLSATGEIMEYDIQKKESRKIAEKKSFLRGLAVFDQFLFVGASKIRQESTTFNDLPIKAEDSFCGIYIINLKTGKDAGGITYTENINEIFSIKILPETRSPALLTERDEFYDKSIMADGELNFWVKSIEKKD